MKTRVVERPRRGRWWVGAGMVVATAAAAMYFLDPEEGRARRIRFSERTAHAARVARRRALRQLHYAQHTARGRWADMTGATPPPRFLEGTALLDRVESELFADRSIPHGKLTLEVEGTTVILRGQVDSADEMAKIETAVWKIPGVNAVESLMHLPGTPAPNKKEALIASANAEIEERETNRLS